MSGIGSKQGPSGTNNTGLGGSGSCAEFVKQGGSNYAARASASSAATSGSSTNLHSGGSKQALSSFRSGPVKATAIGPNSIEGSGSGMAAKSSSSTALSKAAHTGTVVEKP